MWWHHIHSFTDNTQHTENHVQSIESVSFIFVFMKNNVFEFFWRKNTNQLGIIFHLNIFYFSEFHHWNLGYRCLNVSVSVYFRTLVTCIKSTSLIYFKLFDFLFFFRFGYFVDTTLYTIQRNIWLQLRSHNMCCVCILRHYNQSKHERNPNFYVAFDYYLYFSFSIALYFSFLYYVSFSFYLFSAC